MGSNRGHSGRALATAVLGIGLCFGVVALAAVSLSHRKSADVHLGDQTFTFNAKKLARNIDSHRPVIFPDVSGRNQRDVLVQHLGTNPNTGWYAFIATPPGKPRDCTWEYRKARRRFVAKCDPTLTAPATGAGLERFPATVTDGTLEIDLNAATRPSTTASTTKPTTTSSIVETGSSTTRPR